MPCRKGKMPPVHTERILIMLRSDVCVRCWGSTPFKNALGAQWVFEPFFYLMIGALYILDVICVLMLAHKVGMHPFAPCLARPRTA